MKNRTERTESEEKSKIRHYRLPILLYREFYSVVVLSDGRAEAEIVRSLISDAIKKARQESRQK